MSPRPAQPAPADPAIDGEARPRGTLSTAAFLTFCLVTFGWTWGLWVISTLIKPQLPGLAMGLFLASAFGPGIAAVAVILRFGGLAQLRRWLGQCLRWRIGWRWYALAFLAPPLVMLAALGIHARLGGTIPASPAAGHFLATIAQFALIAIFGGPLGEEFGWRGYALPALTERLGWRRASLSIGAVWAVWHLPLFFMANTPQAELPLALFMAATIALSVGFARLSVNTGFSVIPAILLHGAINWWPMILPVMAEGARPYSIRMGLVIVIGLIALLKPGPKKPDRLVERPARARR